MEDKKTRFLIEKWTKTGLLANAKKESRAVRLALELEFASRKAISENDIQIFEKTIVSLREQNLFKE